jgi:NAD+ synthase (glutamine-hydrolysing)
MSALRIALAQINSAVGDFSGNLHKILDALEDAKKKHVHLIAFPEMAITGYPPEDLLFKQHFINDNLKTLRKIVEKCDRVAAVVGFVDQAEKLHNAAAIIYQKEIRLIYHKCHLPNYGVFDEGRYFQAGRLAPVFTLNGVAIGVNICEDIWHPGGPAAEQAIEGGAEVIINISASPYRTGVVDHRERMLSVRAKDYRAIIAYLNAVGGQDELVFDGASLIISEEGKILARAESFKERLLIADLSPDAVTRARRYDPRWKRHGLEQPSPSVPRYFFSDEKEKVSTTLPTVRVARLSQDEEIYQALALGLSDYVYKNGFKKVAVGLSGGIDSALTAVIAVDALGADQVTGVFMPSRYTSQESIEDTTKIAKNVGVNLLNIPIEPEMAVYAASLSDLFLGRPVDTTEENLQSRIRGSIMMALSNKFGWLVLTTGNKSEMSVGYATLYGDMAGGFAVIKDLWKTVVYRLASYRNGRFGKKGGPIPERVLTRPPTAELSFNQTDQDTLPPYAVLDPILEAYLEEDRSFTEIVDKGFDPATVADVMNRVDRSEFKRRQSPVGVKITQRALGRDRRMPMTNRYRSFYLVKPGQFSQGQEEEDRRLTFREEKK